jgi:acyl-CoA synthetase (AMP-forming)/AMP-acid ligase II
VTTTFGSISKSAQSTIPAASLAPRTIIDCVLRSVRSFPERAALIIAGPDSDTVVSYAQLGELISETAAGLDRAGVHVGSRVLIMAAPSLRFYALALGVLASARVLVVVDGRMQRRRVVHALRAASPDVVVAAPSVMRWWPLVAPLRRARRFTIDGAVLGAESVDALFERSGAATFASPSPDADAILAFSSGTTGDAKRIARSHTVLLAQHRALAAAFPPPSDDVNLAGFPMAVLHNLCCGTTTVLPDMTLRAEMARATETAVRVIERCGVTSISAAPAFARALSRWAISNGRVIDQVGHVVVGGGPVSRTLCAEVTAAFPNARASIVYGATEAEPIATVNMRELLVSEGEGFLVGRLVPDVEMVLDRGRGRWRGAGEVLVRGAHVVRPENATNGWHRTGDLARVDAHGRLWLLGRVSDAVLHRERLVLSGIVEASALRVLGVDAAGFVAHRRAPEGELAVTIAKRASRAIVATRVHAALAELGLGTIRVRVVDRIPMDARHESKVARAELARMLERLRS